MEKQTKFNLGIQSTTLAHLPVR